MFQSANGHYLDKAAATLTPTAMSGFDFAEGSGTYDATIQVLPTTGDVYQYQSQEVITSSEWGYQWRSSGTTPLLTLSQGTANNMQPQTGGLYLFSGKSSATTTYTLAVPEGYIITGYKIQFKNVSSSYYSRITLTPSAGGSAATTSAYNNSTTYTVTTSRLSSNTATFTLKNGRSTTTVNYGLIQATGFEVYIEPTGASEPAVQLPWTTSGSTIVNSDETSDWNIYPLTRLDANTDIYTVSIVGAPDASATLNNKARAMYNGVSSGLTAVYDKGYFFVQKGKTVNAAEISGTEFENYNSDATVDNEAKTITLTYTAYVPVVDDEAVTQTLWASPTTPKSDGTAPSYRIPAIVRTGDGSLLAVGDHRYNLDDIGNSSGTTRSKIELVFRRSTDEGQTWTASQVLSTNSTSTSDWNYSTGDTAVIADRESGEVLVYCASGIVGMGASTAASPIKVGCFRSHDYGQTWDSGTNVTTSMYGLYDGKATAMFITSGRMLQSQYVKVGDYYRIYAAFPVRTSDQGNGTGVMYSDDFGYTWQLLGGTTLPNGSVYEEAHVGELPDGSIVLMVRDDNGRSADSSASTLARGHKNFNVYAFTDSRTGTGYWSTAVSGITGMNNATNNQILIVPAVRKSDNQQVYVAVLAMPTHTTGTQDGTNNYGRKSMAFFYKEIADANNYVSGEALAAGWAKGLQVSNNFSAYSDLLLLNNDYIGLLYEGNGKHGTGLNGNAQTECYDLIFSSYSLDNITRGRYSVDQSFTDRSDYFDSSLEVRVGAKVGKAVGMIGEQYAYISDKTQENMEEILRDDIGGMLKQNKLVADRPYIIRSTQGDVMLGTDRSVLVPVAGTNPSISEVFSFSKVATGKYNLYSMNNEVWADIAPSSGSQAVTENSADAETFIVQAGKDGWSAIISQNPETTGQSAISNAEGSTVTADRYNKSDNPTSFWYIEPLEEWTVKMNKVSSEATESYATLYLPFTTALPENTKAYIIGTLGDAMAETVEVDEIPALTPVLLKNIAGETQITLEVPAYQADALSQENLMSGELRDKAITDRTNLYIFSSSNGKVGFYHPSSKVTKLSGNKAYVVTSTGDARGFQLSFGGNATGLQDILSAGTATDSGKYYDLTGRRVAQPQKGVYIINGRKVLVK